MDIATGVTICSSLLIAGITWYNIRSRDHQTQEHAASLAAENGERHHTLEMAKQGYVQVPVPHHQSDRQVQDTDSYGDRDRITSERTWQLAWVHKDAVEDVMLANLDMEPIIGDQDLLEAALQPT